MEYNNLKKGGILALAATQMNLEGIKLPERSQ